MGSSPSKLSVVVAPSAAQKAFVDEKADAKLLSSLSTLRLSAADGTISTDALAAWEEKTSASPKLQLARTILPNSNLKTALISRSARINDTHVFNHNIDFQTAPITDQKSSGRCWLFATTNILRYSIMKSLNLKQFQLSQSYLFFWDKLNKANYYLELSIENAHLPLDDRLVNHLSRELISDGGQWDMVVNIIQKYGLVPQAIYPESAHSSSSSTVNALLQTKLREHALLLRRTSLSLRQAFVPEDVLLANLRAKKEELMAEVYAILTATLGVPPNADSQFEWEYANIDGKVGKWKGTPLEFAAAFTSKPYPLDDSFSLINDPRNKYSKLYTVDKVGNLWGGRPILYVNTEIENLKNAVVKMIKAGQPVFFGCDVGKFSDKEAGIMDTNILEYENAFDITLGLAKAERLQTNESSMTHAMVISGVHLDSYGKPARYKVENSWGDSVGDKGYFVMTDRWFEEYVYQIVVPKALAPNDLVKVFESPEKTVLPPWDPMGTLA